MKSAYDLAHTEKRCTKCGKLKSLSRFHKRRVMKDGHRSWCRSCVKVYGEAYRETHKGKKANSALKRNYNITPKDKRTMWKKQGGRCVICKKELTKSRDCHVDHCHVTGDVRGMLCHKCNFLLGYACENVVILQAAIEYLTKHNKETFNE